MKKIVFVLFVCLLFVLSSCSNSYGIRRPYRYKTKANQTLKNFPDSIDGAGSVEKYEIIGAKYCLVHIADVHGSIETPDNDWVYVKSIQDDIYNIITSLLRDGYLPTNEIFIEVTDQELTTRNAPPNDSTVNIHSTLEDFYKLADRKFTQLQMAPDTEIPGLITYDVVLETCLFLYERFQRENERAFNRLEQNGQLSLLSSEGTLEKKAANDFLDFAESQKSNSALKESDLEWFNATQEARENAVIENIALKTKTSLPIVVFGARHWFGRSISSWNKNNPDKKYSLIFITPQHYDKNYKPTG